MRVLMVHRASVRIGRTCTRARVCVERGGVLTAHSTREVTASPLPSVRTYILHRRRFNRGAVRVHRISRKK